MKYTVYKITNQINGKIYVGIHKTSNLNDGYMGSGKLIRRAITKHGIENFTKEYLAIFDNPGEMFNMETELVNEAFVKRLDTYNLKEGGFGGFDYLNNTGKNVGKYQLSPKNAFFLIQGWKQKYENDEKFRNGHQERARQQLELNRKNSKGGNPFTGPHSEETKEQMRKSHKGKHIGSKNSQYGRMWIYNIELRESKTIPKLDEIPVGWIKGRKLKWDIKKCKKCNSECCAHPSICNNFQLINSLILNYGFDESKIGTNEFYNEYNRIRSKLKKEYSEFNLSIQDIKNKYGINTNETVRHLFKSLDIPRRSHSDARKNYLNSV